MELKYISGIATKFVKNRNEVYRKYQDDKMEYRHKKKKWRDRRNKKKTRNLKWKWARSRNEVY